MKKLYLLLLFSLGLSALIWAQPTFTIDNTTGDPGGTVAVNVKVEDFSNIVGMQFSVNWDPNVLQYSNLTNFTNAIRDFDEASFNTDPKFIEQGQMVCSWFDMSADPNTVPNGTIIFTIEFNIVGGSGSSTTVSISDEPRSIEIIDANETNIGLNSEGGAFTASGNGGGATLRLIGSDEVGAMGEEVCVEISVRGFSNIAGMQFTLDWDESFLQYTSVGAFNLNGLSEGSFNTDNVGDGKLVLQWLEPSSTGISLADGARIFQVCFNILGSAGSRTVQFTNDPVAIEIVDGNDMRVNFTKQDGTVTVEGGGGGTDCNVDGFALVADRKGADPGSEVCVPISVKGFTNISSVSSTIEWDAAVLSNPRVSGINLAGLAEGSFNLDQGANGMLSFVWIDPNADGVTLSDGSEIFEICFDVVGSLGQSSNINFSDALTDREAGDGSGQAVDFNQCDGEVSVGDDPGGNITFSLNSPTCAGQSNGSINITVNFGSAPYTFAWTRNGADVGSSEDLSNIPAGTYIVNVTDGGGTQESLEIILNDPDGVRVTGANITDATDGANGAIALTLQGGSSPYSFLWSNGATTRDIAGLEGGTYAVTITENNGCTLDTAFAVGGGELGVLITNQDYNGMGVSCNGEQDGDITAVASGGTPPYTYRWEDGSTEANRTGLGAGEYNVTVTDGAGGESTASITLTEPEVLRVNVNTTPSPNGVEGTAEAVVSGGTEPYTYRWNDKTPPSTTRLIINLDVGTYTVVVTDPNGCTATGSRAVTPTGEECYTGRLVITPNDDNKNDFFSIACVAGTDNELEVYNRQGELVYEANNYNNDWFGLDRNGDALPDGAYFWVVRVRLASGLEQHTGHVTIIRDLN